MRIAPAEHEQRVARLRALMDGLGWDWVLVFGDDRHAESVRYLTGFAPQFECALVAVSAAGSEPVVVTGVEGAALLELAGKHGRAETFLPFSVQGLATAADGDLAELLRSLGVRSGQRAGLAAERWLPQAADRRAPRHFVPQVVVEALAEALGEADAIANASELLAGADGLRAQKSASEIVLLEAAAGHAASAIGAMLARAEPGISELELAHAGMCAAGVTTFAFDTIVAAGHARASSCLDPPGERRLLPGDSVAMYSGPTVDGYCGNVGRLGLLAAGPDELPPAARDVEERLHAPLAASYAGLIGALRIGATGGELHRAATAAMEAAGLGALYSPGHLIGLAEWEDTYLRDGSEAPVESGHVIQVDLAILTLAGSHGPARLEDGFALADPELREALRVLDAGLWARFEARRERMAAAGLALDDSVLPLSDLAGETRFFLQRPAPADMLT